MERVTRIELALSAWEADVLPLNYTRVSTDMILAESMSGRSLTVHHRRPLVPRPGGLRLFQGGIRLRLGRVGAYRGGLAEGSGEAGVPPGESRL
jgi:hypothetical protein